MKLILATRNRHKILELTSLLSDFPIKIASLSDYPDIGEIIEDGKSFEENAMKKGQCAQTATGEWVLADDSGLIVPALEGEPGVISARYAGVEKGDHANNQKLIDKIRALPEGERGASFVAVVVLLGPGGKTYVVRGECEGVMITEPRGKEGFGYDPIFFLPKLGRTMAELTLDEKNRISHRGAALQKIKEILVEILKRGG